MSKYIKVRDRYNRVIIINTEDISTVCRDNFGGIQFVRVTFTSGNALELEEAEARKIFEIVGLSL